MWIVIFLQKAQITISQSAFRCRFVNTRNLYVLKDERHFWLYGFILKFTMFTWYHLGSYELELKGLATIGGKWHSLVKKLDCSIQLTRYLDILDKVPIIGVLFLAFQIYIDGVYILMWLLKITINGVLYKTTPFRCIRAEGSSALLL